MRSYLDVIDNIIAYGRDKEPTRIVNGEAVPVENGTRGMACQSISHDMRDGFPLLTTKKMHMKGILVELEAFLGGITDKQWLKDRSCSIWNSWSSRKAYMKHRAIQEWGYDDASPEEQLEVEYKAREKEAKKETNDLGPYYAWQMRRFDQPYEGIVEEKLVPEYDSQYDQVAQIVKSLKNNPRDRRMVCSMWNPNQMYEAALPSCHYAFNVIVYGDTINMQVTIRSNDMALGWPYNMASYATLLMLFAKVANLTPAVIKIDSNDAHVYNNHFDGLREQLSREPRDLPKLEIIQPYSGEFDLFKWTHEDVKLTGYNPYGKIKFDVTV